MTVAAEDRRKQIIGAGLDLLREEGLPGLTQPKIAKRTGLRQSHITYYFPTRTDLLAAVSHAAIDIQLAVVAGMVDSIKTGRQATALIAEVTARHDNTRILVALNQAADREPAVRELFQALNEGFVGEIARLLSKLGVSDEAGNVDLVHAIFVGLSVIDLATSRTRGVARSKAALEALFRLLAVGGVQAPAAGS
jgi:AcrR family transcriptional regulator